MTQPGSRRGARDRILQTAFRLFYAHGPGGAGVDTIVAESGVAKTTLYKYFPRKDDLVLAYLDVVDQTWFGTLRAAARAAGESLAQQLVGLFDALGARCAGATATTGARSSTPLPSPNPAATSTGAPSNTRPSCGPG